MDIILAKDPTELQAAISVARSLPEYFNEAGYAIMARDFTEHAVYIAGEDAQVVGFISIYRRNDAVAEISWLGVSAPRHRAGIGSLLLQHACAVLRQQGYRLLIVKTLAKYVDYAPYVRTHRFYAKHDFHSIDVVAPYPGWGEENPCEIYVKVL